MRSLAKPVKVKNPPQHQLQPKADTLVKKQGKGQSKKVTKTVFHSPFRYKIQTLSVQDCETVLSALLLTAKAIRQELGVIIKPIKHQKFINFNSKVKQDKPTLTTPHFIYGIKHCLSKIRSKDESIKLIIFFYDQSKHDLFQQLMCYTIYHRIPYILLRDNQVLRAELGLRKLLSLGLRDEQLSNQLMAYSCKCLIEIPWLVQHDWIPVNYNQ